MLDLTKLSDAVAKVAGITSARDAAIAAADAANRRASDAEAHLVAAQADIDHLAEQLIAAVDTPAQAVGLAAVAAALAPEPVQAAPVLPVVAPADVPVATPVLPVVDFAPAPVAPEAPKTLEELNALIAKQNAGSAIS